LNLENKPKQFFAYKGIIVHSISRHELEIINPGVLIVDEDGTIVETGKDVDFHSYPNVIIHDFKQKIICPGFIDLHLHLPQYEFVGLGSEQLLSWLKKYTFPAEKRYEDEAHARAAIEVFFNELLHYGTTTAAVYPTIHRKSTDLAFGYAAHSGIRLIMGKVNMDQNAPDFLLQDIEQNVSETLDLIDKWHGFNDGQLQYAVTPRFAITCSSDLLTELSAIAKDKNTYIQSHLAENRDELKSVKTIHKNHDSYTHIYADHGLLSSKTLMAHCIYLSDEEIDLIKETNTTPVHCPTSNRFLQSGIFPLREFESKGINFGIGTDVAGGYEISLLHEMKEVIEMGKMYNILNYTNPQPTITMEEVMYYGTLGGAIAIGQEDRLGNFQKGKEADFIVLDDDTINPYHEFDNYQTVSDRLYRLIYRSSKESIQSVFIKGKRIR
jgi:guanine deaminase